MTDYYTAMVCLNGHVITARLKRQPSPYPTHCPECGEPTMKECENCQSPLRGKPKKSPVPSAAPEKHCPACGGPYPWTKRATESLLRIIEESDDLPNELRAEARESVPDLIADTPKSDLAVVRFKKVLNFGGDVLKDALVQQIKSVGTEAIKCALGCQ